MLGVVLVGSKFAVLEAVDAFFGNRGEAWRFHPGHAVNGLLSSAARLTAE
jgi:hypothetical protein